MKNLIIFAHPNKNSFCYAVIQKTIADTLETNKEDFYIIDLYSENKTFDFG